MRDNDFGSLLALIEEAASYGAIGPITPEQQQAAALRELLGAQGAEVLRRALNDAQKQRTRTQAANDQRGIAGWLVEGVWPHYAAELSKNGEKVLDKAIVPLVKGALDKMMFDPKDERDDRRHCISESRVRKLANAAGLTAGKVRRDTARRG